MDGNALLAGSTLECNSVFWRESNPFHMRHEMALRGKGWQAGLGGDALLCSEESFARWCQRQSLERMSAEGEEDVAKEKDARGAVTDSVMRGEDKGAVRLLMRSTARKRGV